ncbi:hypothetical protein ACOMHN_038570 [Nucella lapillus]
MMLGVSVVILISVLNTVTAGHAAPTTSATPAAGKTLLHGIKQILASQQEGIKHMLASMQQGHERIVTSIKQLAAQSSSAVGTSGSSVELLAIKNKLVALESKLEATEAKLETTQTKLEMTQTKLEATQTKLEANQKVTLKKLKSSRKSGSTFIRWGRKTCNNASHLVYSGVAGGSSHVHPGAAANPLCLTMNPQVDGTLLPPHYTFLYGAEYDNVPNNHDHDVPCSVCRVPQSTTIMIPATRACPKGWTTQYAGHLSAGHPTHPAASQYVCMDKDPEKTSSGHQDQNGKLFYYTVTRCGSLPCPPYVNNKVVLCVVCSK